MRSSQFSHRSGPRRVRLALAVAILIALPASLSGCFDGVGGIVGGGGGGGGIGGGGGGGNGNGDYAGTFHATVSGGVSGSLQGEATHGVLPVPEESELNILLVTLRPEGDSEIREIGFFAVGPGADLQVGTFPIIGIQPELLAFDQVTAEQLQPLINVGGFGGYVVVETEDGFSGFLTTGGGQVEVTSGGAEAVAAVDMGTLGTVTSQETGEERQLTASLVTSLLSASRGTVLPPTIP